MTGQAAKAAKVHNHDDVYDRQIRLWGAEAQKRMSTARVLYIHLSGVSCEMLKNLILAGVAAVICDGRAYPEAVRELPSSFFGAEEMEKIINEVHDVSNDDDEGGLAAEAEEPTAKRAKVTKMTVADAVMPKIDELNPLLHGRNSIEERDLMSLPREYFGEFDAIVASRLTVEEVKFISSCLTESGKNVAAATAAGEEEGKEETVGRNTLFIVADTFGLEGCAHLDFGKSHTYRREIGKDKLSDVSKVDPYVSMYDMFDMPLCKVKTGRWDKVVPRGLLLQRLLMNYWGQQRTEVQKENDDHDRFVDFATNWFSSNNLSNNDESATNHINLSSFAPIAAHPEISPVSATLGGVLGNEVIKALTGRGEPANNVLLFDGMDGGCRSFVLCGEKDM
jgi:ubiquitin-like 1-activating enzyme E1 A